MGFGNPHVSKALAAEQKAEGATDPATCAQSWRDASRLWERAADRESDPKRRGQYTANAERTRAASEETAEPFDPSDLPN
ncbi:MAG: hypothetical protein ABMA64_14730 [Myxococcota bacterium]